MIIVADSREQKPLDFSGIEGVEKVETIGLAYGDYSAIVNGKPVPIIYERKSLNDLWGTMVPSKSDPDCHERFKRELVRAKDSNVKLVLIVEGSYTDVWNGITHSRFDGQSMLRKLATFYTKYDLEYVLCESRRVMARRIVDTFLSVERNFN